MIEPPSLSSGSAFWTVNRVPFHIDGEGSVELVFGNLSERGELAPARVGEQDVDCSGLVPHHCEKPVEIAQIGNVALDAAGLAPGLGDRGVKLRSAPACQEDVSALSRKPLRRGKTDAGCSRR